MPMDGLMLFSVAEELNQRLLGGRIDRIQQPERDEVHLMIRCGGQTHRLLLSCSANHARAHITRSAKRSMDTPPQFCMLLRKHLLGGKITAIEQTGLDRILRFSVESIDEMGDYGIKHLIIEMMGRHSNIILTDTEGMIIDSARRVTAQISRVREVLPHLLYVTPPVQDKTDLRSATTDEICARLMAQGEITLDKAIAEGFYGFSQPAARELSYRFCGQEKAPAEQWRAQVEYIARALQSFFSSLAVDAAAVLYVPEDLPVDVSSFIYQSRPRQSQQILSGMSEALDAFYVQRDQSERMRQKASATAHMLQTALERCEKKLALQLDRQREVENREQYRIQGELLMSSLHLVEKGAKQARVPDYYTDGMPEITIALDERLNPAQNAQRYFKLYTKAKAAAELLEDQIARNREEIEYLSGQLLFLEEITEENELSELRQELAEQGYGKRQQRGRRAPKIPASTPIQFESADGVKIYVGKNNVQNDRLTFSAGAEDIWLHAKDMPGSHVIIRLEGIREPSERTLLYAAALAAGFSRGRQAHTVAVDYTRRKYVKKPSGAKPGFVIYTHQKTLYIEPLRGLHT